MNKAKILRFDTVTSTNDEAKKSELKQAVFIAEEQTLGRGSKGRSWQSSKNKGLYMSFLVRPIRDPAELSGITLVAAVTVCEAIDKVSEAKAGIKWPNDVLVGGRKAAGILTEIVFNPKGAERVVCGIGVNTDQTFLGELSKTAVSLGISEESKKMQLCEEMIRSFFHNYRMFEKEGLKPFLPEFRRRNLVAGTVKVILPGETITGRFIEIDDTGAVIIETEGKKRRFIAGEISLRGENGYV